MEVTTLLLVDDEKKVLDVMKPFFEGEGFKVLTAATGPEALTVAEEHKPSLVILDWMLPGMNGLDVCRALRQQSPVGIIMLTARTDETDKVLGLEMGADDYLTKPFGLRELLARVRSVLRRSRPDLEEEAEQMTRGDLVIDEARHRIWKYGQEIVLTPTEFKILMVLASNPGVVYSRLQLLQAAIGEAYMNYERTIDTHVSHLRKKVEDDPANPVYIQTVYGIGYRFGEEL